ncbi:MAG: hypothetical protein A2Y63_01535 [Candidatus Riflebacteria bacterium RBG_13_59_9]|nr:MAG: hypothetical protein A2Y63_01535 [Candidatus Riflebacteria bacterium RBG_13_59_9]
MEALVIKGLKMVVLPVTHWETSRKWYMEKLGLHPVYEAPDDYWGEYSFGEGSGATIGLWGLPKGYSIVLGDGVKQVAPQPYIEVEDLKAAVAELEKRGIEFEHVFTDEEFRTARFRDPEGHVLYLYEYAAS